MKTTGRPLNALVAIGYSYKKKVFLWLFIEPPCHYYNDTGAINAKTKHKVFI